MDSFLIGLQFLTRISVVRQEIWTEEAFGGSVRYFPLIGAVLGCFYGGAAYLCVFVLPAWGIVPPEHLMAAVLLLLPVWLTGGIHCDGFMDTMDGLFSGRSRERMLEIMKDSCVGSNAVVAFLALMLAEYSILLDMPKEALPTVLFAMPIIGRCMMVLVIGLFPYARPEGMGKAFAEHTGKGTMCFAAVTTCLLLAAAGCLSGAWGMLFAALLAAFFFAMSFGRYAAKRLGGVTGDVYGAVTTLTEGLVLLVFLAIC